ncbi:MAG: ATP synthase F1 subunit delta [Christiangramia sp.]|nr:ATP synthase F1 subunit delta [Christiangramia sp.]|tara:strand:+ start:277 stop:831 length:555 start_codon:yes stop_codon:yes gene_type:complete
MVGARAAKRYAKAILSLAKDKGTAKAVYSDMQSIRQTMLGSRELQGFLGSPIIKNSLKKSSLLAIFKNLDETTKGSIDVLLENGRINILEVVAREYISFYNKDNQIQEAVVTTAVPLDADLEKQVLAKVKELTGSEASLKKMIDKSIIGGFILRVGDLQYDASVARNLADAKRRLKDNTYVSKI